MGASIRPVRTAPVSGSISSRKGHEVEECLVRAAAFAGQFVEDDEIVRFDEKHGAAVPDRRILVRVGRVVACHGDVATIIRTPDG